VAGLVLPGAVRPQLTGDSPHKSAIAYTLQTMAIALGGRPACERRVSPATSRKLYRRSTFELIQSSTVVSLRDAVYLDGSEIVGRGVNSVQRIDVWLEQRSR
jgi:hypothetical protein